MSQYSAERHLAGLKQFQRATVDHVMARWFTDPDPVRRFLVADETGLGKSMVARGVIARLLERLQHEPEVRRIDIVYVCSNADIADQNLKRLDVLGTGSRHQSTRLSLLARDSGFLDGAPHPEVGKRVNLIALTPGTSFTTGQRPGRVDERALLWRLLADGLGWGKVERRRARIVLQGKAGLEGIDRAIERLDEQLGRRGPDPVITEAFFDRLHHGLDQRVAEALEMVGRRSGATKLPRLERRGFNGLVGELRAQLAQASVSALEPDLVILDEFQRFRHLMEHGEQASEEAELAESLFAHEDARVLLLSATPYKPFTYAEEAAAGDDHARDLYSVLSFCARGSQLDVNEVVHQLATFRAAAVNGETTGEVRQTLQRRLTKLMCRTERPRLGDDDMLAEVVSAATDIEPDDLRGYTALHRLARRLDAQLSVDYWKSTPYFVNFADGYQLSVALQEAIESGHDRDELDRLLHATQHLDAQTVAERRPVDPGTARMRRMTRETVGAGWWKLLWLPPSLPYYTPGGPFAEPGLRHVSKRLVFSSWSSVPTAIASLLSYDADRAIHGEGRPSDVTPRLMYRMEGGQPAAMSTLALFWPSPALAERGDPLITEAPEQEAAPSLSSGGEAWYWHQLFGDGRSVPEGLDDERLLTTFGQVDESDGQSEVSGGLQLHLQRALALHSGDGGTPAGEPPADLDATIEELARCAPGVIAWRCLRRLTRPGDDVTDEGVFVAASVLAEGFRSLFNRPDSIALLDALLPGTVYWRAVLKYCAWGNLEAVLDEYLHHLAAVDRADRLTDAQLLDIAGRARGALTLRPAPYSAFDPISGGRIPFTSRFALRYGTTRAGTDDIRLPDIRSAFNSPFWPFVLATTSVGQEGIDFHWWCHAAVHWNTPASPVDFEQREGRVHRFGGLAIRRNLADRFGNEALKLASRGAHPWDHLFQLAEADPDTRFGELAPHWITPGPHKIERHVMPYPLSRDEERYARLKDDLVLYRLTFGQPRQEDMLHVLARHGVHHDPAAMANLTLDLRPPPA